MESKPNYVQVEGNVKAMGLAIQLDNDLLQEVFQNLFDYTTHQDPLMGGIREYGRLRITVEKVPEPLGE